MAAQDTTAIVAVTQEERAAPPIHVDSVKGGTLALAMMDEQEFGARLLALKRGQHRIATIQRELMVETVDYGVIPNTDKPTLFKPGAEKLLDFYQYAATFTATLLLGDGVTEPPLRYQVDCQIHIQDASGPVVAAGQGAANSWEKKYRQQGQRLCPACGAAAIKRSKFPPKGKPNDPPGWYCHDKAGGCGSQYDHDEPAITQQGSGTVDPTQCWDLQNTLLKMACKRALTDGALRATATSGLFAQDLEDLPQDAGAAPASTAPRSSGSSVVDRARAASEPARATITTAPAPNSGPSDTHDHRALAAREETELSALFQQAGWTGQQIGEALKAARAEKDPTKRLGAIRFLRTQHFSVAAEPDEWGAGMAGDPLDVPPAGLVDGDGE